MNQGRLALVPQPEFLAGLGHDELIDCFTGATDGESAAAFARGLLNRHFRTYSSDGAVISAVTRRLLHSFSADELREVSRTIRRTRERMGSDAAVRFSFNKMLLIKGLPLLPSSSLALRHM